MKLANLNGLQGGAVFVALQLMVSILNVKKEKVLY